MIFAVVDPSSLTLWINCCFKSVFEKTCATAQKYVKSHVFLDFEKNVKNVKKRTGHLNHSAFNTQSPKVSTGKSPT